VARHAGARCNDCARTNQSETYIAANIQDSGDVGNVDVENAVSVCARRKCDKGDDEYPEKAFHWLGTPSPFGWLL